VNPGNPQSWNRYAYVMNNPLNSVDALGLCGPEIGDDHTCPSTYADASVFGVNLPGMAGGWDEFDLVRAALTEYVWVPKVENGYDWSKAQSFYPGLGLLDLLHWDTASISNGSPANNGTNPIVPANPCNRAGNAPDPSVYQAKGQAASTNEFKDLYYLFQFRARGGLDAQPQGASPAYANYAYGVYMSAAGYTLNQALAGADIYAQYRSSYRPGTVMDPNHPFTPMANVMNITYGFTAQQMGTICHK
jgi:hypothetical protein